MGKIAFVFAGQGSQNVGMGKDLYDAYETSKEIFGLLDDNLLSIMFNGPSERLNETINTQPCLFTMDLVCARLLAYNGITPDGVAGFSLGEIPAITFAGILSDKDGYNFVCYRAKTMWDCAKANEGAMLAVLKLSNEDVADICSRTGNAYPVNYNCPGQIVVACSVDCEDKLKEEFTSKGGKVIKLNVSGGFHSPFMEEAGKNIEAYLSQQHFSDAKIPVYSNLTASVYNNPVHMLSNQVKSPVLWQQTIENMIEDGYDTFIEVGAGKTLSGLIKKINSDVKIYNVCDVSSLKTTILEVENA